MASLPRQQRRSSPTQRSSASSESQSSSHIVNSETYPNLEDSQTVLISPTTSPDTSQPEVVEAATSESSSATKHVPITSPKPRVIQEEEEPRKCWICFADETEDTPLSSEWRSPCPCALTAHESCLLDWIADLEAPGSRRSRQRSKQIQCPQCKSEIVVARPSSWVVDCVRGVEDACGRAILPSMLVLSVSSVFRLFYEYGVIATEVVFGPGDSYQLLEPLFEAPLPNQSLLQHMRWTISTGTRISLGLVSIPPVLVLSRTSLADGILPILPMLFLATSPKADAFSDFGNWPPSAGLSFALLPYFRSIYNFYYDKVWAEKERRWLKEIQPRVITASNEGEGDATDAAVEEVEAILEGNENVIQIDVDFNIVDEWPEGEGRPEGQPEDNPEVAPPLHAPPLDDEEEDQQPAAAQVDQANQAGENQPPAAAVPAQAAAAAGPPAAEQRAGLALNIATNSLADTVLGALAFPFVSAAAGDLLRLVLPRAWTAPPPLDRKPTFFLQARWARSLVGGCLFVVLKDAVMLYVRWKMAQNHRKRRVLNYDKVKKRVVWN